MQLDNITVLDFETSGLDPVRDRVIEMCAIRCDKGEIVGRFNTLIRFDGPLAPKITEITGITSPMLEGGMDEETAFRILNRMIGSNLIVAHNAAFDLGFLHHTLMRLAGRSFSNHFIDTLTISRLYHTYPHTLQEMCNRYGIELSQGHRADFDVLATWELLKRFHAEYDLGSLVNRLGYIEKYGPPKWAPAWAQLEGLRLKYA
ncbi:DNA polymerase III subunit epsilon [Paenibacillus sp. 598K]|uniref:3'-5' exonuclease n=1 Tax=Paenibacillus sp. 598K TaxID=1117987 RepID=UPI000FFAE1D9|nr:3'-5' exonuclease [Paenibacillus sp. 598K]GBF76618.1 DNA polymerase III subunit epsilon [Paenibacillus sp. 598K]